MKIAHVALPVGGKGTTEKTRLKLLSHREDLTINAMQRGTTLALH